MTSPAPASTWAARTSGLTSTSGRHAAPFTALQPACGASRRCLAPRAQALSYDGRPPAPALGQRSFGAPPPPGLGGRPPAGVIPQQPGLAQQPGVAPPQQLRSAVPPPAPGDQQAAQQQGPAGGVGEQQPDEQELRRRQKISAANKGRVPWNKGRKHPPEVIARIKAATQAAMKRPDVRERLAKANERREPHTDEAKEKIRVKLLERASVAREEIHRQAEVILAERLRGSEDPELRALAEFPRALDIISGLAWQYFKKDWSEVSTRGWDEHPEFRERCISKLQKMAGRASDGKAAPRKRKVDKVKAALGHMRKLEEARAKLGAAEEAVAKLRRAKVAFAGDPARLAAAAAAEDKATQLLTKLRQQVLKLEKALQPLEQYLEQPGAGGALQQQQQQRELLEQRLEEAQQQQRERVQQLAAAAPAAANGAAPAASVPGAAAPFANGAAHGSLNGLSSNGVAAAAALNGAAAGQQHAVNGHASAAPAAAPTRATLPWQR
ncbi:hypothetical protein ABPG75_011328 [Micractinium tetrahymenae]